MAFHLIGKYSFRELDYIRFKFRENRKGVINPYHKYRRELYHLTNDGN